MDGARWLAVTGLILGTLNLCRIIPSTFAFEKPLLTATTCLVTLGFSLIGLGRWLRKGGGKLREDIRYEMVSGGVWGASLPHTRHASQLPAARQSRILSMVPSRLAETWKYWFPGIDTAPLIILVAAVCLRIQLFIRILANVECSTYSFEPLLPLVIAQWDYIFTPSRKKQLLATGPDATPYHSSFQRLYCTALMSVASTIAIALARPPTSTYICPTWLNPSWLIPLLQLVGMATDALIVYCIARLLITDETSNTKHSGIPTSTELRLETIGKSLSVSLSGAAFVSATILLIQSIVYFIAFANKPERQHMFALPTHYVTSTLQLNLTILVTALCALFSMLHTDLPTLTLIPTFTALCAFSIAHGWNSQHDFYPKPAGSRLFLFGLAILAFAGYCHFDITYHYRAHNTTPLFRKKPTLFHIGLAVLFLTQFYIWKTGRPSEYTGHAIQGLLLHGQAAQSSFMRSQGSHSLSEAVEIYRKRYGRHPPPGFDRWFEYAVNKSTVIIDSFDSIDRDLLPFRALTPQQIRDRTWEMISNPWHDAHGIFIRNGVLSVSPLVPGTHRWMLDGVVSLIQPFVEFLPDMDLAFNMNDEPRVAVPYEVIEPLRKKFTEAKLPDHRPGNVFSPGRGQQWKPLPEKPNEERLMTEMSGRSIFQEFGNVACPPDSPARTKRLWDFSRLCIDCVKPHSFDAFLADWEKAGDICHQPDLAHLHGLYISPASFKGTNELYPIFSQSKAHGFNDILYPSAWNYIGKSEYKPTEEYPDVPFANKNHSMYWRGMTTEGLSLNFGAWRGMSRQRFIHLAKDARNRAPSQPLLLPIDPLFPQGAYQYKTLSTQSLKNLLPANINFADDIVRCNGLDCTQQKHHFRPLAPRSPFEECWQYKYLLDLDGAGFSGRFLPFLQSRSLPFKAALSREWWDDRVRAWYHFVPLDLRGHGFWATLEYFSGFEMTKVDGKDVWVDKKDDVADRLADNGREWAKVALRKEDMEIYMFRLLLEWGRLTDDRRDEIGYDFADVG